jgi:spore coat protein H
MKKVFIVQVLLLSFVATVPAQNLTLPIFKIEIDTGYLKAMYANPGADFYYPAVFRFDTITYPCEVKFKGASSLNYPKKSWAIKFGDNVNIFGAKRINLNGDYKDHSYMRNLLVLRLFKNVLSVDGPNITHVSFKVNGLYAGVHTLIEQMDQDFLVNHGLPAVDFYKAENHGAGMFALTKDSYWPLVWTERVGNDTHNDLKILTNKIFYLGEEEFDSSIHTMVNVDNVLAFFAVHFANTAFDNFNKNQYVNFNGITGKYEWIPWDNEGSFGFGAFGNFDTSNIDYLLEDSYTGEYNVLFQRLIANDSIRGLFNDKVRRIINEGYSYLDTLVYNTANRIRNDVYQDSTKETSNAEFESDLTRLRLFMTERKAFLTANQVPKHYRLTDFYNSNPFPNPTYPLADIRVKSEAKQRVFMYLADSLTFDIFGRPFNLKRIELYDDGVHNDLLANDLVYGNTINAQAFYSKYIPYSFTGGYQNYPSNGLFYIDYYRSKSFAFNKANADNNLGARLRIGRTFKQSSSYFVEIVNTSSTQSADISYCHFRVNAAYKDLMFLHNTLLQPGDTLIITNDTMMARKAFQGKRICNVSLYFNFKEKDLFEILSPALTPITSKTLLFFDEIPFPATYSVVINEINYNSPGNHNTGDWIELYNPNNQSVDLSSWIFRDASDAHNYIFPNGTIIQPDSFLVVCEDTLGYTLFNNTNIQYLGNLGYGFSGAGELIRLFNANGQLIDSVMYDDVLPWPTAADAKGPSLELKNFNWDNALASSWYAFEGDYGTPGRRNHIVTVGIAGTKLADNDFFQLYPNPNNGTFTVALPAEVDAINLRVINMLGEEIYTMHEKNATTLYAQLPSVNPGVYIVSIQAGSRSVSKKMVISY